MKKANLLFIFFGVYFLLGAQERQITIGGILKETHSKTPISGAKITSIIDSTFVLSDEKGRFQILVQERFMYELEVTHPDFYPFIQKLRNTNVEPIQSISLVNRRFKLDTICYSSFKENVLVKGEVMGQYREELVRNAEIWLNSKQIIAYTDIDGVFKVGVPESTDSLLFIHPEFIQKKVSIKKRGLVYRWRKVKLKRIIFTPEDTSWLAQKNMLFFALNELLTGSIGLSYQRMIHFRHAVGLQTSSYLFGIWRDGSTKSSASFNGIKVAPYYRFYFNRKMKNSGFLYAKFEFGYFNFEDLYYSLPYDHSYGEYSSEQFTSSGFGIGGGWTARLPKSSHLAFSITAGYQYFPMNVPLTIDSPSHFSSPYVLNDDYWYSFGPGSVFEIKILFGGIF